MLASGPSGPAFAERVCYRWYSAIASQLADSICVQP